MLKNILLTVFFINGVINIANANKFNFENSAFYLCDTSSGAYIKKLDYYHTYVHKQISFTILINHIGEMRITAGDILDYDLFKYGEGKRHKDRYYGESIYSSFQLEKSDGRFFFVQDKSDEAIMVTGLCDGFIIANLVNGKK